VQVACTRNKNTYKILGGKLERLGLLRTTRLRWEISIQKHHKINWKMRSGIIWLGILLRGRLL
jgi:hypothetical protein